MLKFNNDNIFTGYIKQLLTSFNLPKYRVYTIEQQRYHDEFVKNYKSHMETVASLEAEIKQLKEIIAYLKTSYAAEHDGAIISDDKDGPNYNEDYAYYVKSLKIAEKKYKVESSKTPEKNVIPTIYRNNSPIYSSADPSTINKALARLNEDLKLANDKIKSIDEQLITETDPVVYHNLEERKATLEAEVVTITEKITKIQAGLDAKYPTYPKCMRYVPYIKDGRIQEYSPKIVEGKIIEYSDDDWKVCHAQFGDQKHEGLHMGPGAWSLRTQNYVFGRKYRNYTKTLQIQNGIYDSYTHEYLGDYLRFLRDYKNINLMPLYNCFSNRVCPNLDLSFAVSKDYTAEFKTDDKNYKIYMVPIKLFQEYTLAIDSGAAIEVCCGLYGQYFEKEEKYLPISKQTYMCFNNMQFRTPQLVTSVLKLNNFLSTDDVTELAQREEDLKLFIKVPAKNNSSIVLLEGDFTAYNDTFISNTIDIDRDVEEVKHTFYKDDPRLLNYGMELYQYLLKPFVDTIEDLDTPKKVREKANWVINGYPDRGIDYYKQLLNGELPEDEKVPHTPGMSQRTLERLIGERDVLFGKDGSMGLNTRLLVEINKLKPAIIRLTNHLFVNFDGNYSLWLKKLITPLQLLRTNTGISYPFADRLIEYLVGNAITGDDEIYDNIERAKRVTIKNTNRTVVKLEEDGLWVPALQIIYYDYMNAKYNSNDYNHDIMGFVDKDVEQKYAFNGTKLVNKNGSVVEVPVAETISSINIYDEWEDEEE